MMRPVNDFLVLYLDSIDKRLLEHLDQDDEVHGPLAAPRKATGVVHHLSLSAWGQYSTGGDSVGHSALERPLETVSSACVVAGTAPTGAPLVPCDGP